MSDKYEYQLTDNGAKAFHHVSQEWDLEKFPTDLLSSTKHGDIDHVDNVDENPSPENSPTKSKVNGENLAKVLSTGSIDMVGYIPTPQELSPNQSDTSREEQTNFTVGSIADFEITEKMNKHGCCVLCKLCCKRCGASCKKNFQACTAPCMTENNPLSTKPTCCERIKYAFMCPPHGTLAAVWSLFIVLVFIWGVLWSLTGEEAMPGGNFFGLLVLLILCTIGGKIAEKCRAPPLLGMLIVGLLLRNVPKVNVAADIHPAWSSSLRTIALVVILTRAGLGLDPVALKKLSCAVIRLAFLPCLMETVTVAVVSHFLLAFPWIWGFMLGFVLAAVSPAVVVPSLLSLQERGLGTDKGIPTLVIAAASVDDVLAISGFGIVLGIAFSKGNLVLTIFKGPLEAVAGVVYGLLFGVMCWYIPNKNYGHKTILRFAIVFFGGLLATFGSRSLDIAGAGALGSLTLAFVAGLGWRKELQHNEDLMMSKIMAVMWIVLQPLLFGLIGAEVDVMSIQLKTIGLGIAVLFIGLAFRSIVSFFAVFGTDLNWKEKFFIPFAWLPKATVQAAIGSVALDTARAQPVLNNEHIDLGIQLLTVAVLVIIITAPLGAIMISVTAPRLLKKADTTRQTMTVESTNL